MEAERRGVPAVAILTQEFRLTGETVAKMRGAPGYRFAIIPHPIGTLDDAELAQRAQDALPQVVSLLVQGERPVGVA